MTVEAKKIFLVNAGEGDKSCVRNTQRFLDELDVEQSAGESSLEWSRDTKGVNSILIGLTHVSNCFIKVFVLLFKFLC